MAAKKRDWSVNREAVKALVAVYGPREASRQSGLPIGTVLSWCSRYKWKKAAMLPRTSGINGMSNIIPDDAGDALLKAMASHKEASMLNLAKFTEKASAQAAKLEHPLDKARAVRDVAGVFTTLWPQEQGGELIEGAILIGAMPVKDNPQEMLEVTADVREVLPDQRPEGD